MNKPSGDAVDPALFQENERTAPTSAPQVAPVGDLVTESGKTLPDVQVAYETWGTLSAARDNAVLIHHALSGDSHAIGWWDRIVGPGRAIDTNRYFVIGSNALGGCRGTTGPTTRAPDGRPYRSRFPQVTIGDMVEVQARLLDHLGIDRLLLVAGGSMGGMQSLEWTARFPARVQKAWVTASAARHSAMQIGFNEAARQAVMRDAHWNGGDYEDGREPVGGLAVARMIGHLSFLSEQAFEAKFGRRRQDGRPLGYAPGIDFEVESYLSYQGEKFTRRFDANSLIVLTKAIDYYDLQTLLGSQAEFLFTSFESDWIYPSHQSEALHRMALEAGRPSRHEIIDLPYGHDAFLLDGEHQARALRQFLDGPG